MQEKTSKAPLFVGVIFILLAGLGAWFAISRAQNNEDIIVAKSDIPAYSFVSDSDVKSLAVPKGSVTSNDLTKREFEDEGSQIVVTSPLLSGQRIDRRSMLKDKNASFAAVLPDERVVAASSTTTGAAVGTIQAGDVVDITVGDSGNASSFAKVICIATEPSGCKSVLPAGVDINAKDSDEKSVLVLLAVEAESASTVAGQSVTLALNPFCRVDNDGYFYSPRSDSGDKFLCPAPANREASSGSDRDSEDESADDTESSDDGA